MQIGTGFLQDLQPCFHCCSILLAKSIAQSLVEFERHCKMDTIDAQKQTKALLLTMALELHLLRFELQIWLSRLLWAPLQTH